MRYLHDNRRNVFMTLNNKTLINILTKIQAETQQGSVWVAIDSICQKYYTIGCVIIS